MEYKLDLLQKRVNHLEDLILAINDKIGVVLDEFFAHRAKQAADIRQKSLDEENMCLSLMSKFKTCFEVPERRASTSASASASSTSTSTSTSLPTPTPNKTSTPPRIPNPILTSMLRAPPAPAQIQLPEAPAKPAVRKIGPASRTRSTRNSTSFMPTSSSNYADVSNVSNQEVVPQVSATEVTPVVDEQEQVQEEGGQELQEQEEEHDTASIIVGNVFGNYSDPDPDPTASAGSMAMANAKVSNSNGINDEDDEGNTFEDPLYPDTADDAMDSAPGPDTPAPPVDDEMLSLLCEPEVYIKTENTVIDIDYANPANHQPEADTDNTENTINQLIPPEPEDENLQQENGQVPEDGPSNRKSNTKFDFRRVRAFKNLDDGKLYMKMNSMITRSASDLAGARHYYYKCKDKKCRKVMYLAKYYTSSRVVLYDKAVEHNHPPFPIEVPTPRTGAGATGNNNTSAFGSMPTFKLIQTFTNRGEAMAKIQAQEPGAWVLNQVVECPDSVKAYYNCGLHSGGNCPKSMVLRTFNENGKVDQYIWQGGHVPESEGNGYEFADYFTPPPTVSCKSGRHMGRTFTCIRTFATEEEAKAEVAADTSAIWDLRAPHHTIQGKKLYFGCKHRKCPVTMYLQVVTLAGKVFQYLSQGEHDHTQGHQREKKPKKVKPGRGYPHTKDWATVANFATEAEGREHIRNEYAWAFRNSFKNPNGGKKMYYLCKHDVKCPVRCSLIINGETGAAAMCVTTKEAHVHNSAPRPKLGRRGKKIKLAPELRGVIDQLYAGGFRTVEKILRELEARGTPAPPYHVFGYLARLRRMTYGRGRGGRRPKIPAPIPSRVLSGNPKNEQRRKALQAAAEAKRVASSGGYGSSLIGMDHMTATTAASALMGSPMRLSMVREDDSPEEIENRERIRQRCLRSKVVVNVKRLEF